MPLGIFLSTLSLRRATTGNASGIHTHWISIHALLAESDGQIERRAAAPRDFYPRSPCGERRILAYSSVMPRVFLSTLSLRRATDVNGVQGYRTFISIHALLAESDWSTQARAPDGRDFYPRSPCGERPHANRYYVGLHLISIHALLAESDTIFAVRPYDAPIFLSTLSLRRATGHRSN